MPRVADAFATGEDNQAAGMLAAKGAPHAAQPAAPPSRARDGAHAAAGAQGGCSMLAMMEGALQCGTGVHGGADACMRQSEDFLRMQAQRRDSDCGEYSVGGDSGILSPAGHDTGDMH